MLGSAGMRAALLAAVLAMSCRYDLDTYDQPSACAVRDDIAVCAEAAMHSDFRWLQDNLFSTNCSGDACHNPFKNGRPPTGKIVLVEDLAKGTTAYETLLGADRTGAPSDIEAGRKLVDPGNPNNSYLMFLLRGVPAPPSSQPLLVDAPEARQFNEPPESVGYMPKDNNTLCCQKLDAVRRWIAAGAPND
jgi:hypothetical protein